MFFLLLISFEYSCFRVEQNFCKDFNDRIIIERETEVNIMGLLNFYAKERKYLKKTFLENSIFNSILGLKKDW